METCREVQRKGHIFSDRFEPQSPNQRTEHSYYIGKTLWTRNRILYIDEKIWFGRTQTAVLDTSAIIAGGNFRKAESNNTQLSGLCEGATAITLGLPSCLSFKVTRCSVGVERIVPDHAGTVTAWFPSFYGCVRWCLRRSSADTAKRLGPPTLHRTSAQMQT